MVYRVYPGGPECWVWKDCWMFTEEDAREHREGLAWLDEQDVRGIVYGAILPVEE